MNGKFYYHEIIRRTAAAFGTMFNNIYIRHQDGEWEDFSYIKVPIAYGPIQNFLARVEQKQDLRNRTAIKDVYQIEGIEAIKRPERHDIPSRGQEAKVDILGPETCLGGEEAA